MAGDGKLTCGFDELERAEYEAPIYASDDTGARSNSHLFSCLSSYAASFVFLPPSFLATRQDRIVSSSESEYLRTYRYDKCLTYVGMPRYRIVQENTRLHASVGLHLQDSQTVYH